MKKFFPSNLMNNNMGKCKMRKILGCVFVMFLLGMMLMSTNIFAAVIQIGTIEDLQKIGNDVAYPLDGEYELTQDINASATLNWNNGAGFKPIGTSDVPFVGKIDGKEHKITGLYISRSAEDYVGLFGYIGSGGEVKNLGLENCWVIGNENVGSLVGYNDGGSILSSYSTGAVSGIYYVGGLVGENGGSILSSYSTGAVSGYWDVGGLVGFNWSSITSSYSTGAVSGSSEVGGLVGYSYYGNITSSYSTGAVSGSSRVGGLAGFNWGSILSSYSTGTVSGSSEVGGLVGYNFIGSITSSYWDVETSGQSSSAGGVGKTTVEMKQQATYVDWDFVNVWMIEEGVNYPYLRELGPTQASTPLVVETREISSLEELSKIGLYPDYPWWWNYELMVDIDASETINWDGGKGFKPLRLFGKFDGNGHVIRNLYINRSDEGYIGLIGILGVGGEVKNLGLEDCWVVGNENVGGLVGGNGGSITSSYSTGAVSGSESVGGLVGYSYYGNITSSYSTGAVSGYWDVGGLVGYNWGSITSSYSTGVVSGSWEVGGLVGQSYDGSITSSYSTGAVSGSESVGGLVGYNFVGSITSSYWDIETSGQSSSDGGEGKTTVEMKQQATYVGWDFVNVWMIEEGVNYPYLRELGPTQSPIQPPVVETREISSLGELSKIGYYPDYPWWWNYELMVDIDASETINWDGGKGFKPLRLFGKFDGNGHVIRNLYINRSEKNFIGLFGYIGSVGEVKNLGLEDCWVVGNENVGGLVGYNVGSILSSYSTGEVYGYDNAGGLVGYNVGSILSSYSTGEVYGDYYVGGLVGYNDWDGSILSSYSTGAVSGVDYIGGLVGYNDGGTITSSYWDVETSGQSSSAGGEGKATVEMKQQTTYVGWDFVNVWNIVDNFTYPFFRGFYYSDYGPGIIILGETEFTTECGEEYIDAGATAYDIPDGDLTAQIIVTNNVNIAVVGDYTIDYLVTDSSEHTTTAQRIVHVVDTTSPEITLNGTNPLVIECKSVFEDPGATATDSCDSSVEVVASGTVNTNVVGEYTITYNATDASGNIAESKTRTVQVIDTTSPEITLNGTNPLVIECKSVFEDPGATATDSCDGSVEVVASGTVNTNVVGEYAITYNATDASGNTGTAVRIVNVVDTTSPEITLNGANPLVIECKSVFENPGATATDSCDNSVEVVASGTVNTNVIGEYAITYNATDASGNIAESKTRTVQVVDTTSPEITLNGANPLVIECNSTFTDPGATAADNCDNEVSVEVVSNNVDTSQTGTYQVVYRSVDSSGNTTEVTREVLVDCGGEGTVEGSTEGTVEGEMPPHSADPNGDGMIDLGELLRVIQFFNMGGYHCEAGTEDGYAGGYDGDKTCTPHASDYNPQDWKIDLSELLRLIQFFNMGGYYPCPGVGEDDYCPGTE